MLNAMQQPAQAQPSPGSSSFAGLLASLASPHQPENDAQFWSGSDLGEDVVTLSYESALRTHARYRPADRDEWQKPPANNSVADDAKASDAANQAETRSEQWRRRTAQRRRDMTATCGGRASPCA